MRDNKLTQRLMPFSQISTLHSCKVKNSTLWLTMLAAQGDVWQFTVLTMLLFIERKKV